jgi:hypothetical protein
MLPFLDWKWPRQPRRRRRLIIRLTLSGAGERADRHRLRQQNRQLGDAFFRLRFVKQNHASDAHVAPAPCN